MNLDAPQGGARPDEVRPGPLAGILVVALEHAVAAPIATRQLADLGARVVKIERSDGGDFARDYDRVVGGGLSSTFLWSSRGKESVVLDLKSDSGRGVLDRLLGRADVLVHNLGPGALDRMGFAPDTLRHRFPRLVVVTNSGYGDTGPYAGRRAYDAIVQAESGVVANTGTPETMAKPGFSAADVAAGMYMFSAVLTGLYQRERENRGCVVDIVMLDAITDWIGSYVYYARHGGDPARIGIGHPSVVPYGAYRTADGTDVVVGVQNDREWRRFAEIVLRRPELAGDDRYATNPARAHRRDEVDRLVADELVTLRVDELERRLSDADVAHGRIRTLAQAHDNPQFTARDRWVETPTPVGSVPTLAPVVRERGLRYPLGAVPDLGEHTAAVLAELGVPGEDASEPGTGSPDSE